MPDRTPPSVREPPQTIGETERLSQDGRNIETLDVAAEVAVAANLVGFAQKILAKAASPLLGAKVLEIGPGSNLAHALHLSSLGVEMTLVDRFPTQWNPAFHIPIYEAFLESLNAPSPMVEAALSGKRHSDLRIIEEPAEDIRSLADDVFDGCMSNAVMEHVYDFEAVARELYRVSRKGGVQGHQVDFRDHRDFSRPLEFLTIPDDEWRAGLAESCFMFGNRVRPREAEEIFESVGFKMLERHPNNIAFGHYLDDVIARLPSGSRFGEWPPEDIATGGVLYFLRK